MSGTHSFGPVVVGVDGSDAAVEAVTWAVTEAVHRDVPLRLVCATRAADRPMRSGRGDAAAQDYAERSLHAACLAAHATGLPVKVDTAVVYGHVDAVLADESRGAALICVGSTGISRLADVVIGSTAATLARTAHCPVAVIRRDGRSSLPGVGFVAVVVDDQPGNDEVMRWALDEARMRRAPLLALGVWRWALFEDSHDGFNQRLDDVLQRYPDVEVEVATTRSEVTRYLETFVGAIQLVVVGRDDAHRVAQLVGPRGPSILAHADCSVLVVRDGH